MLSPALDLVSHMIVDGMLVYNLQVQMIDELWVQVMQYKMLSGTI